MGRGPGMAQQQQVEAEAGDADDIWLQPHSDDICFSLGLLAAHRRAGTLLTIFPVANYIAAGLGSQPAHTEYITQLRLAEDLAFATACGLETRALRFTCALARGDASFDAGPAAAVADSIELELMRALMGPTLGQIPQPRRRLFCPMGIGGHVDHLAVLLVVLRHYPLLAQHYRLGFYEDLHYASDPGRRGRGLQQFAALLQGRAARRQAWALNAAQQTEKLRLVRLYASQMTPQINQIGAYAPAVEAGAPPHEAVWTLDPPAAP